MNGNSVPKGDSQVAVELNRCATPEPTGANIEDEQPTWIFVEELR